MSTVVTIICSAILGLDAQEPGSTTDAEQLQAFDVLSNLQKGKLWATMRRNSGFTKM